MNKLKALLGALLVATSVLAVTGCSSADSSSESEKEHYEDQTMAPDKKDTILDVIKDDKDNLLTGELENKTIKWMATWDINPDGTGKKTPADLLLFQERYGGKIDYINVTWDERYDKLSEKINGDDGVDFFYAGDMDAIPKGAIKEMFVPADDYIDFDSDLWADVADANDMIMWNNKHYAAVTQTTGDSIAVIYNRKTMQEAGLDDPAKLYENGEWTWDTFQEMLEKFVDNENGKYGIDGWWFEFGLINTIGVPPIGIEDGKLVSHIGDPEMERVQNWMFEMYKKGLIAIGGPDYGWEAKPNYIGEGKLLFYPVGLYELYKEPEQWKQTYGEDAFFVPMPKDPNADEYYVPMGLEAYAFVSGGKNPEGVAKYLDCKRYCLLNEDARAVEDAVFTDDYGWSQEMVDMKNSMWELANENPVVDISKGVSDDCGKLIDDNLRLTTRGTPWNETYNSIASVVQKYLDDINKTLE